MLGRLLTVMEMDPVSLQLFDPVTNTMISAVCWPDGWVIYGGLVYRVSG